jgi:hypothetical protein
MDSKRKVSQVLNNNPQGSRLRGRPYNRWWNCVQIDKTDTNLKTVKGGQKIELTGRNPLTLWPWSWTFTVQHTIYVKCEYFMNQEV